LEKIGNELFLKQRFKEPKQRKIRARSSRPGPDMEIKQITEEEYLRTLYPNIDYTALDLHCSRAHYDEWYRNFIEKVFERSNKMKYDMFIKRCQKTSPYNDNGGEKYNILKNMAREKKRYRKKSYERNTVAFLAKGLCSC
jgi:hypothetical protein